MSISVKSMKSFIMSQKVVSLGVGLFILNATFSFVKDLNDKVLGKAAKELAESLTEKINIGRSYKYADVQGMIDSTIVFVVSMLFIHLAMKIFRLPSVKIPFMGTLAL